MKTRDLLQHGSEKGHNEGIKTLVITMQGIAATSAQVTKVLIKQFKLHSDDAEKKVTQYWVQ